MQEMEPSYYIISLSWVGEAYVFKFLFIFFDEYSHTLTYVKIGYCLRSIFKQLIIIKKSSDSDFFKDIIFKTNLSQLIIQRYNDFI